MYSFKKGRNYVIHEILFDHGIEVEDKESMSLSKKYALQRLRELQYKRNRDQPFESEDRILLEMQELMDFLKQDPSVRNYLKKTLYEL